MYRPLSLLCLVAGLSPSLAGATDFALEASTGGTSPSVSDYSAGGTHSFAAAYTHGNWRYRLGYTDFGDLTLRNAPDDTYIELDGTLLQVSYLIQREYVTLELGAGLLAYSAQAVFGGSQVGKERDTSPQVDLRLTAPFGSMWQFHAGYRYYRDVSGTDLRTPYLGLGIIF